MAKKLTKSARIRRMLERGNTVKQITAALDVTPQFVYQVRSQEKKAKTETNQWANAALSTSDKPIKPRILHGQAARQARSEAIMDAKREELRKSYISALIPKDYAAAKPTLFQRIKNFFMGV